MAVIASAQYTITDVSDGTGIYSVSVWYYESISSTSLIGGTWSTDSPTWTTNNYIWSKTVVIYDDDEHTTTESTPVCITGYNGADGISVISIEAEYYLSDSNTEQTGSEWKPEPDPWEIDKYLWTRNKITYSDGTVEYTTPYCDTGWDAVNTLMIGGRNYIRNSRDMIFENVHAPIAVVYDSLVGTAIVGLSEVSDET